ncbi:MAG: ComEC/Rec2 family competence protein [bacterium]|nr:ComEC/Rec2 family competence protein [bacterium]
MSSFWQQMPFVRILLPFILGIIACSKFAYNGLNQSILLALTAAAYLLFHYLSKHSFREYLHGIWFSLLYFLLGIFILCLHQEKEKLQHFSQHKSQAIAVQITEKTTQTEKGWKAEALVLYGIDSLLNTKPLRGKIVLYAQTTPGDTQPSYGDQLLIKSGFQEISPNKNPGAFNYQLYLQRKGIFYATYLRKNQYLKLQSNQGNTILKKVYAFQYFIHQVLQNNLQKPGEIGIAEALLYGYDKDIEDDITDAYSKTGTLHVLAVSGMHVGLIFMILSWLLKPLEKLKRSKKLIPLLQVLGIWIYALICGFSPSILRACVMFTFVIMGKQIGRNSNPFNSLSASAFLLLLTNPNLIYNVGFQLSYAAVGGILGFYPYLYHLFNFKRSIFDEIWKILAVSLAAQTLTLPLSIFYFHQIPLYFLLANLLIIPLTSIIIYAGIILLIISPFPFLASLLGKLIAWLIQLTNHIAVFIADLPYSYLDQLNWDTLQLLAYYLICIGLIQFLFRRDIFALKAILAIFILLQIQKVYVQIHLQKQFALTIYSLPKNLAIQYQHGNQAQLWQRSSDKQQKNFKNQIQPNLYLKNIVSVETETLDTLNYLFAPQPGLKICILQNRGMPAKEALNIVLICGKHYVNIEKLISLNRVQKVVINGDVPKKKSAAIKKILQKHKIPCHDVTENGAFEVSL